VTKGPVSRKSGKKGGRLFPALCNVIGTLAILAVIALLLPMTAARLLGYEVYNVISGSMAPAIPEGSLVMVRRVDESEIREGDVIAFGKDGSVVTHRVIRVDDEAREFITKGDANEEQDMHPVAFVSMIGRVERSFPYVGGICAQLTSVEGKLYALAVLVGGVLMRLLAGRMRNA